MSFTQTAHVVHVAALADSALDESPLAPDQVVSGDPVVRSLSLHEADDLAIGVWQHSVGVSTDIEADEIFVVLTGRATVEVEGGPLLEVGPGDVGLLPAGAVTRWTIHETLRKVYVVRP